NPRTDSENNGHLSCPFLVWLRNFHPRNCEPLSSELIFFVSALLYRLACEPNELVADKRATMKFSLVFSGTTNYKIHTYLTKNIHKLAIYAWT
ncbi:MAG: hypothetical protein LBJ67_02475, partial [Planctomycetaceae bacterium]|nr:hypothetical protein [Planctomycetaceae bacterium]